MGNIVHRNNALKDKMVASNVLMGLGNDSTDTVEKRIRDLEEGGGGSGSVVVVTPLLDEGVHIADISVNGRVSELYAPEGGGGTVTDVLVDGVSVVNQDGEAEIDLSDKQDKLVAGTNVQIGQDGKTISATDTTYSDFVGATSQQAGTHGLVPAPLVTEKDKFLKGDGTWDEAGGGNVDDVVMNGQSIVDANKIANFNNYVELTQAQYDALPASKLTDGILYCIKDTGIVEGEKFAPVIYSLEEREIGVWTDGKPLYEKTLHIVNQRIGHDPNASPQDTVIPHGINNLALMVSVKPCMYDTSSELKLPSDANGWYLNSDRNIGGAIRANNSSIYFYGGTGFTEASPTRHWYFTLRYTKTTDVPGSGTWGTDGVPMVHYDGNEKVIGTWFGETLYEKTYLFDTTISLNSNTWTNTSYDGSFIGGIIDCKGYAENMIPNAALLASKSSNDLIQLLNLRTSPINCKGFTIQYTKTS